MIPKIRLYCETTVRKDIGFEDQAEQAVKNGADAIEFDPAGLTDKEAVFTGQKLFEICKENKAVLFVRGRADLALVLNAAGVVLSADGISVDWAKRIMGPRKFVGFRTSQLGRATSAVEEDADFVLLGPIYSSCGTKPASGVDSIRMVKKRVKAPLIAWGGINKENVEEAIKTGADGVAVMKAVCGSENIRESARQMKDLIVKAESGKSEII